jgi:hypothetical protein
VLDALISPHIFPSSKKISRKFPEKLFSPNPENLKISKIYKKISF